MIVNAIIFDLGGTLIEYAGPYSAWPELETPGLEAAYAHLHTAGLSLPPFDTFRDAGFAILPGRWQAAVAGERNLRLAELLAEVTHACLGVDGVRPEWLDGAARAYEGAICAQAAALPGARETLAALRAAGYSLGLLSNTMFSGAAHRQDLARFGLDEFFDVMLFSADANKWKPMPAPYLHVAAELGVAAETAVFIGDSPEHDIVGAHAAGMRAVLIQSSQRFPLPAHVRPDATIRSLPALPDLLARW